VYGATSPLLRCPSGGYSFGSFGSSTHRATSCARRAVATSPAPERRAPRRSHSPWPQRRLRGARPALSAASARLLPAHARLPGGRRGCPAGGLHGVLQRDPRRRPSDKRAAVAVPDRTQPLPEPPAPASAHRAGLDGRVRARRRRHHGRHRASPGGVPADRRGRTGAARDPAHRPPPAGDRCALLRADRRGDGHDGAERQVAPRARARGARRGGRVAAPHLRGGAARWPRGSRGARLRCAAT
jgi:hypothetical protein